MSTFTVRVKNAASNKPGWPKRARSQARRARQQHPQALAYVELYNARRPLMTALLVLRYYCAGFKRGKVLYLRRGNPWRPVGKVRKWSLGNGKHAIAVPLRHKLTGDLLVVVVAHLSWQHGAHERRRQEADYLARLIRGNFRDWAVIALGDWNDSRKSTGTRPDDTTGHVFARYGLHDLEKDIPASKRKNRLYNSAHAIDEAPQRSIHLDRAFGNRHVEGVAWGLAVHHKDVDSDHWALDIIARINRKAPA